MVYNPDGGCVKGREDGNLSEFLKKNSDKFANKVGRKLKDEELPFDEVKDSGERRITTTGAVRDRCQGKGRFDLISPIGLRRLAVHYENGAVKYKDRNWEKGMPLSWFVDSASRHIVEYMSGDRSEDHWAAVAWNAFGFMHIEQLIRNGTLPKELDDLGITDRPLIEKGNPVNEQPNTSRCNKEV